MLHLIQLYKMVNNQSLFIKLFNDLSYELTEMGYENDKEELVNELLQSHFGIEIADSKQLQSITDTIVKYQNKLHVLANF